VGPSTRADAHGLGKAARAVALRVANMGYDATMTRPLIVRTLAPRL